MAPSERTGGQREPTYARTETIKCFWNPVNRVPKRFLLSEKEKKRGRLCREVLEFFSRLDVLLCSDQQGCLERGLNRAWLYASEWDESSNLYSRTFLIFFPLLVERMTRTHIHTRCQNSYVDISSVPFRIASPVCRKFSGKFVIFKKLCLVLKSTKSWYIFRFPVLCQYYYQPQNRGYLNKWINRSAVVNRIIVSQQKFQVLTPGVLAWGPNGYLVQSSFSSVVVSKRTTAMKKKMECKFIHIQIGTVYDFLQSN